MARLAQKNDLSLVKHQKESKFQTRISLIKKIELYACQNTTSRHLMTLCHFEAASSTRFIIVKADPASNFEGQAKDST